MKAVVASYLWYWELPIRNTTKSEIFQLNFWSKRCHDHSVFSQLRALESLNFGDRSNKPQTVINTKERRWIQWWKATSFLSLFCQYFVFVILFDASFAMSALTIGYNSINIDSIYDLVAQFPFIIYMIHGHRMCRDCRKKMRHKRYPGYKCNTLKPS